MSEALEGMCQWAFTQQGIQSVIAETEEKNVASQRVLQKGGMKQYKESTNSIWWKLNKEKMENNKAMIIRQETKEKYQGDI